jgi:hypothetical protein
MRRGALPKVATMVQVILVEESPSESAQDIVQRQAGAPPLVILGWRALQHCATPLAAAVVGLASSETQHA